MTAATNRERLITTEGYLKDAFDILDVNKDGLITVDELKKTFAHGNSSSGTQNVQSDEEGLWDKLLKGIDKDGDGQINFYEFEDHMMQLLLQDTKARFSRALSESTAANTSAGQTTRS